jgi:2-amino-4-hydroxy-6-hydroxymethyldihydropteridine diphosphokinase
MAEALISLGSNLGDRAQMLELALAGLQADPDVRVVQQSRFLPTQAVGGPEAGRGNFLTRRLDWRRRSIRKRLLERLMRIESEQGRQRAVRWEARSLDLDLLLYDAQCLRSPHLTVPHPRMTFRRFVLEPAAEVAPI